MSSDSESPGVAVITGTGTGRGAAIARTIAASGCANLPLCNINVLDLQSTGESVPKEAAYQFTSKTACYDCDVSDPASVIETFAQRVARFGRIDYVVKCCGGTGVLELQVDYGM